MSHVPQHAPAVLFKLFGGDYVGVVQNSERAPEVRNHIFSHIDGSVLIVFEHVSFAVFKLAEHRRDHVHNARLDVAVAVGIYAAHSVKRESVCFELSPFNTFVIIVSFVSKVV